MAITNVQQMLNGTYAQMDKMMDSMVQQSLKGKQLNQAQKNAINNMKSKMSSLFRTEYTWEKFEPTLRKIYKNSFTQEEVNGMISFYKTPSGQALIKKMPAVMQNTMVYMQSSIQALTPRMEKIQQEFIAEINAAEPK